MVYSSEGIFMTGDNYIFLSNRANRINFIVHKVYIVHKKIVIFEGEDLELVKSHSFGLFYLTVLEFISICDPPRENRDKGDSTLTTRFHSKTIDFDFSTLKACSETCLISKAFVLQDTLNTIKRA